MRGPCRIRLNLRTHRDHGGPAFPVPSERRAGGWGDEGGAALQPRAAGGRLSRHIIAHKADYYRLLLDVTREGAWEPWVLFMLRGIGETARWTTGKIAAIRLLQERCVVHVRQQLPGIYSRELVDAVFEFPYCRISNLTERGLAKRQTASVYLKELVRIGVLTEKEAGRERFFINPRLMQLLTRDSNVTEPYSA